MLLEISGEITPEKKKGWSQSKNNTQLWMWLVIETKSDLIGKDSDAGRDWGQEEKGMTEDEMAGWHHWLDGHESEWTPGVGDGQGGLVCCDSWGRKESDTTERLNWTETKSNCNYYTWISVFITAFESLCFVSVLFVVGVVFLQWNLLICTSEAKDCVIILYPTSSRVSIIWLVLVRQLCPTVGDPIDCSSPGSSVRGIFQARILEWVAVSFSRGSSSPRDWTLGLLLGR